MAGNSISLFPIMMVGMMFVRPVQTLFGYKEGKKEILDNTCSSIPSLSLSYYITMFCDAVFSRLTGDQAVLQKMVYVLANLLGIALAVYKCNSMGLLPTAQSDWLEFMAARQVHM